MNVIKFCSFKCVFEAVKIQLGCSNDALSAHCTRFCFSHHNRCPCDWLIMAAQLRVRPAARVTDHNIQCGCVFFEIGLNDIVMELNI